MVVGVFSEPNRPAHGSNLTFTGTPVIRTDATHYGASVFSNTIPLVLSSFFFLFLFQHPQEPDQVIFPNTSLPSPVRRCFRCQAMMKCTLVDRSFSNFCSSDVSVLVSRPNRRDRFDSCSIVVLFDRPIGRRYPTLVHPSDLIDRLASRHRPLEMMFKPERRGSVGRGEFGNIDHTYRAKSRRGRPSKWPSAPSRRVATYKRCPRRLNSSSSFWRNRLLAYMKW